MSLSNARILVTGATGFIGSRLVQWLVEVEKAKVVAFVHQFKNASRISRFPIEMIQGDVTDLSALTVAMQGCTHVVHAALTSSGTLKQNRRTTIEGARNVCEATRRVGIPRAIYLSTIDVYGKTPPGVIDENTPCRPMSSYGKDKLDAEQVFRETALNGLESVILRLPVVYGPWSFWSTYPMQQLRQGCVILPDEGTDICNAMYVDDAVQCIACALKAEINSNFTVCLVSGPDRITWKSYYEEHGKARGNKNTILGFLPKSKILDRYSKDRNILRKFWELRDEWRIVMRLPGASRFLNLLKSIHRELRRTSRDDYTSTASPAKISVLSLPEVLPEPSHLELMTSKSMIRNNKVCQLFGFQPTISFAEGMEKTRSWLIWTGLSG